MRKRIEAGTDIAMIGVWDPAHERPDLKTARSADFEAGLETEARAGRLFYVQLWSDGSYDIDLYVDEEPPLDDLQIYTPSEREFLISSQSGRLMADGIEYFVSESNQGTSDDDPFQITVAPGMYALRVYQLQSEELDDRIPNYVDHEDLAYYDSKFGGVPWGCLLFLIAAGLSLTSYWIASVGLFVVWLGYLSVRSILRRADVRFQEIADRVEAVYDRFPAFIFVLRRITERGNLEGGWYDLN